MPEDSRGPDVPPQDVLGILRDDRAGHPLDVGQDAYPRALQVFEAVIRTGRQKGYLSQIGRREYGSDFEIVARGVAFPVRLIEEYDKQSLPIDEQAAVKYDWQRIKTKTKYVRSGRLQLWVWFGYNPRRWADRTRWSVFDKLPEVFRRIEVHALATAAQREAVRLERERAWAIQHARQIIEQNRLRLGEQMAGVARADAMRAYARRVNDLTGPAMTTQAAKWIAWINAEADRIDPLCDPAKLTYYEGD